MITEIRRDIQNRLDQLLSEADKLRKALSALGGGDSAGASSASSRSSSRGGTKSRSTATRRTSSSAKGTRVSRGASGSTKEAVLTALKGGSAMTAADVAKATGLGRASVSTTLSRLAKSGEVTKAERGYRLPDGAGADKS